MHRKRVDEDHRVIGGSGYYFCRRLQWGVGGKGMNSSIDKLGWASTKYYVFSICICISNNLMKFEDVIHKHFCDVWFITKGIYPILCHPATNTALLSACLIQNGSKKYGSPLHQEKLGLTILLASMFPTRKEKQEKEKEKANMVASAGQWDKNWEQSVPP